MRRYATAPMLLAIVLASGPAPASEIDVPEGVGLTGKDQSEKKGKKKKTPAYKVEGATVGKAIVGVMVAAGSGWVSGKAYKDNPLTERSGDGPSTGKGMHDSGTAARWIAGYILPTGWLLAGYARLGLTRGQIEGYDDEYDAWILGFRIGKIFYSKHNIDIFWMAGVGYGHMKHRISNVVDPRTEPDDFIRTDLWPFTSREKVDIYKKSKIGRAHV